MAKEPNKKAVGAFPFVGILILIGTLLMFFGDKWFQHKKYMQVLYFEGSVKGLNVGSPVVFRGVQLGRVERIDMLADMNHFDFIIPVYISIDPDRFSIIGGVSRDRVIESGRFFIRELVGRGLCGQLMTQSMVTGQTMISLDLMPDANRRFKGIKQSDPSILEIPTIASPMDEFAKSLQDIPLRQIAEQFNVLLTELNESIPPLLDSFEDAVEQFNIVLTDIHSFTDASSTDINQMVKDFSAAARSFKDLADYLERHPEALLKGKRDR